MLQIYEMLREGRPDGSRKSRSCSVTGSLGWKRSGSLRLSYGGIGADGEMSA